MTTDQVRDNMRRDAIWSEYVGSSPSSYCFCCNTRKITTKNFHVQIVDPNNGDMLENYRPICGYCMSYVGSLPLIHYMIINKHYVRKEWYGITYWTNPNLMEWDNLNYCPHCHYTQISTNMYLVCQNCGNVRI